ncbi:MAG: hypothetical protein IKE63_04635, partial [Bacilli bacterium]|nr:hypothetical protein [Bacilli bacterium]
YNGEVENNQCLNTRGTHVGYGSRTTQSMSTTYYYGTSYAYDKTNNVFSLNGTITTGTIQTGQYTCKSTSSTGTCATLYLIDALSSGTTYYVLTLKGDSHYSEFGTLQFNQNYDSPAYVGYMYNKSYPGTGTSKTSYIRDSIMSINTSYYYSDAIDYGNIATDQYTLINPQPISNLSDYSELVGKYILWTGGSGSDTQARYVLAESSTYLSYKSLIGGNLTVSMMIGDTYTDNGNGTYTINNPTLVKYEDWFNGQYSSYKNKYACTGTSATCANLIHISPNTGDSFYQYVSVANIYKYSSSVSYSGGIYTLTGDIKEIWDYVLGENQNLISTHHYTCFSTGTSCAVVNYINYISDSSIYYTQLSDVIDEPTALINMLSSNDVNQINSTIKTGIDAWYKRYMTNYTSKLEDTIFCNDRSILALNGWDSNGGDITSSLTFKNHNATNDLNCVNITDRFSMSNTKAQLTYPVGLIAFPETQLLNNGNIKSSGRNYWSASPTSFYVWYSYGSYIDSSGLNKASVHTSSGVRPVISLKPGTEYVSGTGSMADPYVVE